MCGDVTVSMLVQHMSTEFCNETSMHTKAVNSSHNWRRTPARQDQSASRKCTVARTEITRIIEDSLLHAFASRKLKTSTRFAHMTLQICSNRAQKIRTSRCSLHSRWQAEKQRFSRLTASVPLHWRFLSQQHKQVINTWFPLRETRFTVENEIMGRCGNIIFRPTMS